MRHLKAEKSEHDARFFTDSGVRTKQQQEN